MDVVILVLTIGLGSFVPALGVTGQHVGETVLGLDDFCWHLEVTLLQIVIGLTALFLGHSIDLIL